MLANTAELIAFFVLFFNDYVFSVRSSLQFLMREK